MRDVAVVSFAQTKNVRRENRRNEVEMLIPVIQEAVEKGGVPKEEIDFYCSGSSDYLAGQSFSFVMAVDALGAWPPIAESHVEMDGAWALYEAWIKIQCGEADSALIFSFGRSSPGVVRETMTLQLDPYTLAPLGADPVCLAALQARALLDSSDHNEREMAEIAVRNRADAKSNPYAQLTGDFDVDQLLGEPYFVSPLRKHDCPPISDGAIAMVIAAPARPGEVDIDVARGREGRRGGHRRRRTPRTVQPSGADPPRCTEPRQRGKNQPVRRRAGGQFGDGCRPDANRRGSKCDLERRRAPRIGPCDIGSMSATKPRVRTGG